MFFCIQPDKQLCIFFEGPVVLLATERWDVFKRKSPSHFVQFILVDGLKEAVSHVLNSAFERLEPDTQKR